MLTATWRRFEVFFLAGIMGKTIVRFSGCFSTRMVVKVKAQAA
jgi:hypothetical protein